ncbi:MAG TPA: carboxypeptidase-like regulatory domain-containing protein, partial [Planctomycetota bacterium]|nr:carboxypeptidase-like regulatory domain-containing protein [Planctomycetota bacterium]
MRRLHLLFVVVALLLLAALGFWLVRDPSSAAAGGGAVLAGATSRDAARREAMATRDAAALAPSGLAVDARSDDTAPAEAASATPAAAPDDGSVAARFLGRVVDETGVPIAGATVVYWPNEYTLPLYGLTQWASGTALEALPRAVTDGGGRFALEARHRNGVSSWSSLPDPELVVIAGEYATRTRRCEAYGGGERDVGDIALEPGARLTGRIVDETGLPIAGAAIGLWNPGGHSLRGTADRTIDWYFAARSATFGGARSGADGRFRTGPLWDGTVQIGVQAEGFIDVWIDRVAVKVGADNDRGDIVLARGAAISGIVRDAQEAPVAGARLIAWEPYDVQRGRDDPAQERDTILRELSSKSGDSEASTGERTGADGRFAVPGLPATNHRLIVDADGYEPLLVENLLPGGAALILTLTRAAALRLVVRDAVARQPVAGAVVHARRLSGDEHDEQGEELPVRAGDAAGTFLVERLGRVRTVLSVSAPGFAATTLALDGIVAPGRLERTLELLPEARVTGRITDVSGAPIAKAIVLAAPHRAARSADEAGGAGNANATDKPGDSGDGGARPSPELEAQSATTDVQGSYALAGLAAGEWTLVADAEDFAHVERTVTTSEGAPLPDTDFVLPAAASLHGTCFASDGTPKAGSVEEFQ